MQKRRTRRRGLAVALRSLLAAATVAASGSAALAGAGPAAAAQDPLADAPPAAYAGDASHQAALVEAEDERIQDVRMKASLLRWDDAAAYQTPQCTTSTAIPTCVLVPRTNPYRISDLTSAGLGHALEQQADGSYLLTHNLFVAYGATLVLDGTNRPIRMMSDSDGFTSIVSYGGRIELTGSPSAPLTLTSWDDKTHAEDTTTDDGRAYVRAIGGQLDMDYVKASNLGFWSGKTGGIALTGTTRPDALSTQRAQAAKGKTAKAAAKDAAKKDRQNQGAGTKLGLVPASALDDQRFQVLDDTLVSGSVTNSTITGDAYGLFVSGATDIVIDNTVVEKSLVDGITLHRYVSTGKVEKTVSRLNAGNGFVLARATENISINQATAEHNRADGFKLSGDPLADGPSATGADTRPYGNNSVQYSVARENGRYGIEVVAGLQVTVSSNIVTGNDMGIVASGAVHTLAVTGNQVTGSERQGIALRDGITGASVSGNQVEKGSIGLYVRSSVAKVFGNTVRGASSHGIALVGSLDGSSVTSNVLAGRGPSAIDSHRQHGADVASNTTSDWVDTTALWAKAKRLIHPMTVIWVFLLLLLAVTAVRGRRARGVMGHPYADKRLTVPQQTGHAGHGGEVAPVGATAAAATAAPAGAHARGGSTAIDLDRRVAVATSNGSSNGHPRGGSSGSSNGSSRNGAGPARGA
ncbi:copper-binding protein NosD [Motilibacter peucedani]|uniref:Copper-binding protein NosD n=1 Tax=Motilibacter peucedani TaxID=598650 RepID=A0A420XM77_9ACTN|nr:right-handed parallel beta-helix repeat-containing protein [Motilibacter peucedani]RKS71340.1 copper-binding protein NosD [Motilibacter peucedani]